MKMNFTRLAIAGLFIAANCCNFAMAQGNVKGIDVSHYSAIRFNTDVTSQQEMDQINKEYHDQLLLQDPKWDEKRASYEQQIQDMISSGKFQPNPQNVVTLPVVV